MVVDEATSPRMVVDEATSPRMVVDEATSPRMVVDEATSPDCLARMLFDDRIQRRQAVSSAMAS
jgi:hypothetical protein